VLARTDAALDTLVRAGRIPRDRAQTFKKRAADQASASDYGEALSGIRSKYAGIGPGFKPMRKAYP
jgi:hypothetical protein